MIGDVQVDLKLVGAPQQLSLSAAEGQRTSTVVAKLKSELMILMTAEIQDPNSKDIQGDWLEEQISEDEQPKAPKRKQRNKRKAGDH